MVAPVIPGCEGFEVSKTIPFNVAVPLSDDDGLQPVLRKEMKIDIMKRTGKNIFIIKSNLIFDFAFKVLLHKIL